MTLHAGVRTRIDEIERLYGIGLSDLKGHRSFRAFVQARHHLWWLLVREDGFSLPRAGRVTGHHHTTVLHGLRQHEAHREQTGVAA